MLQFMLFYFYLSIKKTKKLFLSISFNKYQPTGCSPAQFEEFLSIIHSQWAHHFDGQDRRTCLACGKCFLKKKPEKRSSYLNAKRWKTHTIVLTNPHQIKMHSPVICTLFCSCSGWISWGKTKIFWKEKNPTFQLPF